MSTRKEVKSFSYHRLKRDLGLTAAVALCGKLLGSGIFTSAASLAAASNPKTASWPG